MELDPRVPATCPWPVDTGCFDEAWTGLDDSVQERSLDLASATLRRLTGYRVGGCPITVRPCKPSCWGAFLPFYGGHPGVWGYGLFNPGMNFQGQWVNSCGCRTNCSCGELCEIALPAPVGRVDEVKVDGVVLDDTDYRVDGDRLVYLGGDDCVWPSCQNLALADTEVGTFSVTYLNAYPVDSQGAFAAAVLAMEFSKACSGGKCRLPSGVTQIARQGITMTISTGAFPDGLTGIREVDAYIGLWNPNGLRQSSRVWSPDMRTPRVVG